MPATSEQATTQSLAPCPSSPNCVCSTATDTIHKVAPFPLFGTPEEAIMRLASLIVEKPRAKIKSRTGTYLHAEFTSLIFRFTDDVEFLVDAGRRVVDVRSASRIGYGDLGVNRQRVEQLRAAYLNT